MSANEKQPSIRSTASAPTVSHLYLGSWPFLIQCGILRLGKLVCVINI